MKVASALGRVNHRFTYMVGIDIELPLVVGIINLSSLLEHVEGATDPRDKNNNNNDNDNNNNDNDNNSNNNNNNDNNNNNSNNNNYTDNDNNKKKQDRRQWRQEVDSLYVFL